MLSSNDSPSRIVGVALLCVLTAALVRGQESARGDEPRPTETLLDGSLESGFLLSPHFKFTDLDGEFSNLAGAYGGWVINHRLLIGGGGYTLTNGSDLLKMTYGGGVVEYFHNSSRLVHFSLRGLVGGGTATLGRRILTIEDIDLDLRDRFDGHFNPGRPGGIGGFPSGLRLPSLEVSQVPVTTSFFLAEPEANVILNLTEHFRLNLGGGYRFVGGADGLAHRLDGFTANVALNLTFF